MKKVLIITYHWPPGAGPGVQRFLKFCKYLMEFDWEPTILTVKDGNYPAIDESLLNDVPDGIKVYRTKTSEPYKAASFFTGKKQKDITVGLIGMKDSKSILQKLSVFIRANFFIPDARKGWKKYAVKKAVELISENKIDAIITTGPPQSTHLIGLELKKRFHLPWIADFRDPWTTVYYNKFFPRLDVTKKKDKALEDKVIAEADCITVVSEGLKEEFEERSRRIEVIYNGYDEDDVFFDTPEVTQKFLMSYIGNFKPNQNIMTLWEAMTELINEKRDFKENLEINLIGKVDIHTLEDIKKMGLSDNLHVIDFVPHDKATKSMLKANLLLFIIPYTENNQLILTGKIFEYLASRTPMLSIGPTNGNASKLITEAGRDKMIEYDDKSGIKQIIVKYYNEWKKDNHIPFKHLETNLNKYTRRDLTRCLSEVLNELIK
ncbi:MAG: glycosyltransferase family 4 protein [Bacteroidota bacterium]